MRKNVNDMRGSPSVDLSLIMSDAVRESIVISADVECAEEGHVHGFLKQRAFKMYTQ